MEMSDFIKPMIKPILEGLKHEVSQFVSNRLLEHQVEEYRRSYYSKTLIHRANPIKLDDFYVPLRISKSHGKNHISTDSVSSLFEKIKNLTIIGDAGSGKSTLVKSLIVNSVKEKYKIPVKIELRYLNHYEHGFYNYIINEIFKFESLAKSDVIANRLLDSGKFIFFLDGFDELYVSDKSKLSKEIDSFIKRFNNNDFVIASRPEAGIYMFPMFSNYYICGLSESEVKEFISKQMPSGEKEVADKIIEAIQKEENIAYHSFLANPLLLSMFILTFQTYSIIPTKKSIFYRQVFDTLYLIHDSVSKLSFTREMKSGLGKESFEDLLQVFSFISFFEGKITFNQQYLEDKLNLIKSKKENLKFENHLLIDDLCVAINIMQKDGFEYSFPHRSMQEYFAAMYVCNLKIDSKEKFYNRFFEKITDLGNNYNNFFELLEEVDKTYIKSILYKKHLEEIIEYGENEVFDEFFFLSKLYIKKTLIYRIIGNKIDIPAKVPNYRNVIKEFFEKNLSLFKKTLENLNNKEIHETDMDNDIVGLI